jgi:hypothetical protein
MNFDAIWLFAVSASVIVSIAITGFIALKIGIISFKIVMDAIMAAKGLEIMEGPIERPKYAVSDIKEEKDVISLFIDYTNNLRKAKVRKNYTQYAYMQLFKK